MTEMILSARQRLLLTLAAVFGLVGPNGVFLYFAFFRWNDLMTAMRDPVTLAFVIEAFLVVALLAWYFAWRPIGRRGWKLFVVLSLVGGLGFGIPAFILLNSRSSGDERG